MLSNPKSQFLQYLAQTSPEPMAVEIASARGNYLYDSTGKAYLDLIAGISVCNIGHQHPQVVSAIEEQLHKHLHVMVYGEVVQSKQSEYGNSLVSILPESLNNVYFTNSGAEAIDAAMKLAKRVTGKFGFVAQTQAYHGSIQGPLSLMSDAYFTDPYKPLLGSVYFINQNDTDSLAKIPWKKIAGVVVEIIQAEKGTTQANISFLASLRALCDEHCVLLIFDEIQTGFGRTGALFAFQRYQIIPDILVLGKALGGGLPMGAMIAGKHLMQQLSYNPVLGHITTFGGHPLSAAAGNAALNVLLSEINLTEVQQKGERFKQVLKHPEIQSVDGIGLLLSVKLSSAEIVLQLIRKLLHRGIFTDWFLFAADRFRICPPLTISEEEVEHCCEIILEELNNIKTN
jgi:acetylornithine/succinyldiaminopimelate/putrescine aminotransferase